MFISAIPTGLGIVLAQSSAIAPIKPAPGATNFVRLRQGEILDLSGIANENITLVKLGARLVVLFADRSVVVIEGVYTPSGDANPQLAVKLDATTQVNANEFVAQFPISSDESILTAAGVNIGPLGAGGINVAAGPAGSALQPLSALTPPVESNGQVLDELPTSSSDDRQTQAFGTSGTANFSNDTPVVTPPVTDPTPVVAPTAAADTAQVSEAGVTPPSTVFAGVPQVAGSVLTNDTSASAVSITGVQAGAAASATGNVGTLLAGSFGTLRLLADGNYTYELDNAAATTQRLAQGIAGEDVFTYTITDAAGQTASSTLTITVNGSNDAPTIVSEAGAAAGSVTEDAPVTTTTGTLVAQDVDAGAVLAWSGNAAGALGDFVIDPTSGVWTYTLDNARANALAAGQSVIEQFTATVTDQFGAAATRTVSITVNGSNDAPTIVSEAGAAAGSVTEDAPVTTTTGTLVAQDVDAGAVLAWSGNAAGALGDFVIDPTSGVWTYTLDNARANSLAAGQSVIEQFTATVTDQFGATATRTVSITVNGSNDPLTLDLDTTTPGVDYTGLTAVEAARSTDAVVAANGVTIVQTDDGAPPVFQHQVTDPDGSDLRSLTMAVQATGTGDRGTLTLGAHGVTVPFTGTVSPAPTLTLGSIGANLFAPGDIEAFLAETRYVNTETTFAMDIADRQIVVSVTDSAGATRTATAFVPVIASVTDTTGLDAFTGTRFDDVIDGLGGNNTLNGAGGDDTIRAGDGDNVIDGGTGNDTITVGNAVGGLGALGRNVVNGGEGADIITSGSGTDIIDGGSGDNTLNAGDGDNTISAGDGRNTVTAGIGDDRVTLGNGDNVVDAGAGDNTIIVGNGSNQITTTDGSDVITAGNGINTIQAGDGDNVITAGNGGNVVTTGSGDDTIVTGSGNDRIASGGGTDRITSGAGSDTIRITQSGGDLVTLTDFQSGQDQIEFEALLVGGGLAVGGADTGALDASRFAVGNSFTNGDQRFLFNTSSGQLLYDADGSGAAAAVAMAQLEAGNVAAADIRLV